MIEIKNFKKIDNKYIFDFIFEPTYGGDPLEDFGTIEYEYGNDDFELIKPCNRPYFSEETKMRYYNKIFNWIDNAIQNKKEIPQEFRIQWY